MLINLKKKAENLKKIILLINGKKPVPLSIPDIDEKEADSVVIKEASSKVEEVTELPDISSEKETTLKMTQ